MVDFMLQMSCSYLLIWQEGHINELLEFLKLVNAFIVRPIQYLWTQLSQSPSQNTDNIDSVVIVSQTSNNYRDTIIISDYHELALQCSCHEYKLYILKNNAKPFLNVI